MTVKPIVKSSTVYQIRVQGWSDARWSRWFDHLTVTQARACDGTPITLLTGPIPDQAILRGILNQIWDLNLTVLSVTQAEPIPR